MRNAVFYTLLAIVTVVGIGLYFKSIKTQSNPYIASGLSNNTVHKKDDDINTKWAKRYSELTKKDKNLTTNKIATAKIKNSKVLSKNRQTDKTLPPQIQSLEIEVDRLLDETIALNSETQEIFLNAKQDEQAIEEANEKTDQLIEELNKQGLIDKEKIDKELAGMTKPATIKEMQPSVKKEFVKAKDSASKLSKILKKLNIIKEGE